MVSSNQVHYDILTNVPHKEKIKRLKVKKDYSCISAKEVEDFISDSFIKRISYKLSNKFYKIEDDDKQSCKNLAVLKTLWFMKTKKDAEKKAKPSVLFYRFYRNELLEITDKMSTMKYMDLKHCTTLSCSSKIQERTTFTIDIEDILERIEPSLSYVFVEYVMKERTLEEIGKELMCSKENVRKLLSNAKEKIREYLC